jgi:N-acetylglutamate synthase-like GNAT family acetyltransferase
VNCVKPEIVEDAIRSLAAGTRKPIVVYPNSGERWVAGEEAWHGAPGHGIAALARRWADAGARHIGGCCRVGPDQIAGLSKALRAPAIRPAAAADLPAIHRLLEAGRLPTRDLPESRPEFLVAAGDAGLVGAGGLEVHGDAGLLRSLVVAEDRRGTGLGRALVDAVEAAARRRGLRELVLLTETAHDFFARLGYADIARDEAPAAIRGSVEFRSLCPQSARCMRKRLDVG